MSPEQVLWACASIVLRDHGNRTPHFVAERLGALALVGDVDGIRVWKAIAARIDQLTQADRAPQ
jgi:hypothetical protein